MPYTTSMSIFVQATKASQPETKNAQTIGLVVAGVFIVMAVAQLFTFEKFPAVIANMWLPGGDQWAPVRAALIVIFEVFAIPFLLRMQLSPLMRVCSMILGWVVIAGWLVATLWENLSGDVISNSGLLGATMHLPNGWWSVFLVIALGVLTGWASWGMWPLRQKHS
jgi:hypothetical protein